MSKLYFIKTYGCQMNKADSEKVKGILETAGYKEAPSLEEADIFLINTCSVRQASEDKVYGIAPKARKLKMQNAKLKVVLTGCMVGSAMGERKRYPLRFLQEKMPWVDRFVLVRELVEDPVSAFRGIVSRGELVEVAKALGEGEISARRKFPNIALVPVMRGCDHFCSYCVVPYGTGKEISRPMEEIVQEVEDLVKCGYKKIMLLGQNINSYGKDLESSKLKAQSAKLQFKIQKYKTPFAKLLAALNTIEGLEKISFLTSNPWDMSDDITQALKLPKVEKYLHLPVQSGDDEILKKMNRGYTAEEYQNLVKKIRQEVPGIKIGTDVIVGFPGETKEQFQHTVDLFKELKFDQAFIAMYSERPGTAAAKLYEDDVSKEEKRRRHAVLMGLVKEGHSGIGRQDSIKNW